MKHLVKVPTTVNAMFDVLQRELPQYQMEIKKNPLMGFEYVEIRKSSTAGAWVRLKNDKIYVNGVVPSTAARIFLGGLLMLLLTYKSRKEVENAAGEVIMRNF